MIHIKEDDLSGPEIRVLLETHFAGMLAHSPADSCHFLDFDGLNAADVTFWSIWDDDQLAGCGALKAITGSAEGKQGEIKSMRTDAAHLRKGIAAKMLTHIIAEARDRGYQRLSLETGSGPAFVPAIALYQRFGFTFCGPFGDYTLNPFSRFMTRAV
ncbi:MAG: GNAT family N-acetyltransferase [Chakrabartia sp.]